MVKFKSNRYFSMLSSDEAAHLSRAGFVLEGVGHNVVPSVNRRPQHALPLSNARPTHRNGKIVKWRSKLTKDFSTRIASARNEPMQVMKEDIIIANKVHVFHVKTHGSEEKGITYSVTLCDFRKCSCMDFLQRDANKKPYTPCKHMYYIYIVVLGLSDVVHDFMHQAALSKLEIFQALKGQRNIT